MTSESMLYPHRVLVGGQCGCTYCVAEEARDAEQRDKALSQVVYEHGVDVLRADALQRVTPFMEAFR